MKELKRIINQMLNKQFLYGTTIHTITHYEINEVRERFYLYTDQKPEGFDRTLDAAQGFLKQFQPVNMPAVQPAGTNAPVPVLLGSNDLGIKITAILMDNIAKVQTSADYIPQAEAVNNSISTLIEMAKVEVANKALLLKMNNNI